jgi:hypothetical protein
METELLQAPGFEESITEAIHCYELAIQVVMPPPVSTSV